MSTRPTPALRRALAAAAVVLALGVAGSGPVLAQTETTVSQPGPSTEPVPVEGDDTATTTTVAEGDDATTVEDAQAEADADLRSVWMIVAALGAVAFGLLVLLVIYVRATNPKRAAARREALAARAEERRRAKEARRGGAPVDPVDDSDSDFDDDLDEADDDRTEVVAAVAPAAAAPAAEAPAAAAPLVGTPPARKPAAVLSRDPEDGESGVRVLGAPAAGGPTSTEPARPESPSAPVTTGTGATRRRAKPLTASAAGSRVAPAGPPPGPAEGDETVRIVPAPTGPSAVPTSAGSGAVVTPGGSAPSGDRPPPRSLVDSPPPPRRPRRVEAPAKKLGTADAERVLVRPGQKPVRLPPSMTAPGDAPDDEESGAEDPDQ